MNRRTVLASTLAVIAAGGLGAAFLSRPTYWLRYRLKLAVRLGTQTYEGSSVIEIEWIENGPNRFPEVPKFEAYVWGEAVAVAVGEAGVLFGLLRAPEAVTPEGLRGFNAKRPEQILIRQLAPPVERHSGATLERLKDLSGEFEMYDGVRPILTRFRDITDKASAELVDPNRLSDFFGGDAHLESATISVTTDDVTETIESRLPWLTTVRGSFVASKGNSFDPSFSGKLIRPHFKVEGD